MEISGGSGEHLFFFSVSKKTCELALGAVIMSNLLHYSRLQSTRECCTGVSSRISLLLVLTRFSEILNLDCHFIGKEVI